MDYINWNNTFTGGFLEGRLQQDAEPHQHVAAFSAAFYRLLFPMKIDAKPESWINEIVGSYLTILKMKNTKTIKGMRLSIVVGVIIHAKLVESNFAIPRLLLIGLLNKTQKPSAPKITVKKFNDYYKKFSNTLHVIYPKSGRILGIDPAIYIDKPGNLFFDLSREDIMKAKKLARKGYAMNNMTDPEEIAIQALAAVGADVSNYYSKAALETVKKKIKILLNT